MKKVISSVALMASLTTLLSFAQLDMLRSKYCIENQPNTARPFAVSTNSDAGRKAGAEAQKMFCLYR